MKKIISIVILLAVIIFSAYTTYNFMYTKTIEDLKKKKISEENRYLLIAKITNTQGDQLRELLALQRDYKLDLATLKVISKISNKFNVKPIQVMEALALVDLTDPQLTRKRVNLILKDQMEKLYWLETKDVSQEEPWIKERKKMITMCQLELALLDEAEKNEELRQKLQRIRGQYLHDKWQRLYKWKGEKGSSKH